jgi:MoaA/NifB/PqqE/SkfB family radical SAM enzyme
MTKDGKKKETTFSVELFAFLKKITPKWGILIAKRVIRNFNYLFTKKYFTRDISNINSLEFHLTQKCNYRCEYCMGSYSPKSKNAGNETINNFIKLVSDLNNQSVIKLIGGEPTFHPRFMDIAECVIKHKHDLHIATNFSFPNESFEKLIDVSERNNQITLLVSLHLSQIKSIDDFMDKVISLKKYGSKKVSIQVSSVILNDNIKVLKNIHERLVFNDIPMMLQRLKINSKTGFYKYTDEIEDYLMEYFPDRVGTKIENINPFGMMCKTGYSFIRISLDGEVNRCYNFQHKLYGLGNINKNWEVLKDIMPCLSKKCTCLLPVAWNLLEFGNYNKILAKKIKGV